MRRKPLSDTAKSFRLDRADWVAIGLIVALAEIPCLLLTISLPPLLHLDSDSCFEIAQRLARVEGFRDLTRRTLLPPPLVWLESSPTGLPL